MHHSFRLFYGENIIIIHFHLTIFLSSCWMKMRAVFSDQVALNIYLWKSEALNREFSVIEAAHF